MTVFVGRDTLREKDVAERSAFAIFASVDPALDDLRNDHRFKAMLKQMNLPE